MGYAVPQPQGLPQLEDSMFDTFIGAVLGGFAVGFAAYLIYKATQR